MTGRLFGLSIRQACAVRVGITFPALKDAKKGPRAGRRVGENAVTVLYDALCRSGLSRLQEGRNLK
jgi:hypothetical protein